MSQLDLGAGGAAVISINGDTTAAQTITATTPIQASTTGGTTTISFITPVTLSDGATPALNASLGSIFLLVAAGNRTIAVPSNPLSGQKIIIVHTASGAARTLALNTGAGGFRYGTDIAALTETASGKIDYIGCVYNAADSKWDVVAYTKGF